MKRAVVKLLAMMACVYAIAAVINLRQDFVSTPETRAFVTGMCGFGGDPIRDDLTMLSVGLAKAQIPIYNRVAFCIQGVWNE